MLDFFNGGQIHAPQADEGDEVRGPGGRRLQKRNLDDGTLAQSCLESNMEKSILSECVVYFHRGVLSLNTSPAVCIRVGAFSTLPRKSKTEPQNGLPPASVLKEVVGD